MRARSVIIVIALFSTVAACRKEPSPWDAATEEPWMSGGSQTVFDAGAGAFGHAFPQLSADKQAVHDIGDGQFNATFVSAPAPIDGGLGPVFNSVSCTSCHIADGRGKPPAPGEQLLSMLFRISMPGSGAHGGPAPVPGFGGQLQPRAIFGAQPEGDVGIAYAETPITLPDGTIVQLRAPSYALINTYAPLPVGVMLSPRVAPPVFGLGLLEAIDAADILARTDEYDANGDGISGRANEVWNVLDQRIELGRFGWKAEQPTVLQQSSGAYVEDMGITNPVFPHESCAGQPQYDGRTDDPEVTDSVLHAVAFYIRTLAVPARRGAQDDQVKRGAQLFSSAKCDRCHLPEQHTVVNVAFPEISNQTIFPYTDLLLHDMGSGLADDRPTYSASGSEWRTAPLWGIGLTQVVNGHQYFLHDGRARSLLEAVLWHGGEAQQSRDAVRVMTTSDRVALLAFLNSL